MPPAVEACSLNHWARRLTIQGFPCSSDGKESPANAGDPALIPGSEKSPGEGNGSPFQFLPGKFHEQKSLASYSPWGCKESELCQTLQCNRSRKIKNQAKILFLGYLFNFTLSHLLYVYDFLTKRNLQQRLSM